jgi:uncharacterized iron-regulated protein
MGDNMPKFSLVFKTRFYLKILTVILQILINPMNLFSETNLSPGYYLSTTLQKINYSDIELMFKNADVLILGEEHDDIEGHKEKANLFKNLVPNLKPSLSLEMFETDQQLFLDEYLRGIIDDKQILKETRVWNNLERDYLPLLQIAKSNSLPALASNTPRRYTRIASRGGMEALQNLPDFSKDFLPPLYLIKAFPQIDYENKFFNIMGGHSNSGMKNFFLAQELWDTSMSHSIANHVSSTGNKVIHVNGRFHSDEGMGVTYRLKKMGMKVVTISMFPLRKNSPEEDFSKLADIIYISPESLQK